MVLLSWSEVISLILKVVKESKFKRVIEQEYPKAYYWLLGDDCVEKLGDVGSNATPNNGCWVKTNGMDCYF
jgi:hypothetical protein